MGVETCLARVEDAGFGARVDVVLIGVEAFAEVFGGCGSGRLVSRYIIGVFAAKYRDVP